MVLFIIEKIKRTSWTTPEKKIVRKHFNKYLHNRTLPTIQEVEKISSSEATLCKRTSFQIKAWINRQNKKQERLLDEQM